MKKTALVLMIVTILTSVLGFVREIILSYFYGASSISDAYLISITVPLVIFGFIGAGISTGFIPMYSKILQQHGKNDANNFTNNLINILVILSSLLVIFSLVYTKEIVRLFASGFEGETLDLAVTFTRISLFGMLFPGVIYILNGLLQINGNYIVPALLGLPTNLIIIIFIIISYNSFIIALPIGTVIATAIQLLFLFMFINKEKYNYNYSFVIQLKNEHVLRMAYIALPVIFSVSITQINIIIDRSLASQIVIGGVSALNYANKLNGFIQGVFVLSLSTIIYPMISKMAAESNFTDFKKIISDSIKFINLLIIPVMVGIIVFSESIVILLFGRGAFDSNDIYLTSNALFYYSMGLLGLGVSQILTKAFYSLQDTKTPMILAAISMGINIILNIILSRILGLGGLALATSIATTFLGVMLFVMIRRKLGAFGIRNIIVSLVKISISSLIMGYISKSTFTMLLPHLNITYSLLISITLAIIIYFITIILLKVDEVRSLIFIIKERSS
jgi:putative peptidoglycan lipid II flippase